MKTTTVPIGDIKPNPDNPRHIKDDKFKKLVTSIKDFPQMLELRPIVVDSDGIILGGNMRLKACQAAGLKEVPVIYADQLTEDQKREFIIKDNVGFGEWDWDVLANEWDEVVLDAWGLDVPGFDIEEEKEAEEDGYEVPDEITTDIVLGDLFEIGSHRLLCGDSTDSNQVDKLMNGNKSDIMFTSPPYNAGSLNVKENKNTKDKYNSFNDNMSDDEYFDFITSNIDASLPYTEEIFYNIGLVQSNKKTLNKILFHYNDIFKDIIYWQKSSVAPHIQDGVVNNKIEFIWCFGDGKRKFKNAQFSQGSYFNVIEGPNASLNQFAKIHKATFPIYLPENIISNFSRSGSIVLDTFIGTGTTMVAAHQLDRRCYGMELDPKYCQVILDRMLTLDPTLEIKRNGEPYATQRHGTEEGIDA